ncbi:hypothetical protein Esti_000222 [Eimeria stiedai]
MRSTSLRVCGFLGGFWALGFVVTCSISEPRGQAASQGSLKGLGRSPSTGVPLGGAPLRERRSQEISHHTFVSQGSLLQQQETEGRHPPMVEAVTEAGGEGGAAAATTAAAAGAAKETETETGQETRGPTGDPEKEADREPGDDEPKKETGTSAITCMERVGPLSLDVSFVAERCVGPMYLRYQGNNTKFIEKRLLVSNKGTEAISVTLYLGSASFTPDHQHTSSTQQQQQQQQQRQQQPQEKAEAIARELVKFRRKHPTSHRVRVWCLLAAEVLLFLGKGGSSAETSDNSIVLQTEEGAAAAAALCTLTVRKLGDLSDRGKQEGDFSDTNARCQLLKTIDFMAVTLDGEADEGMLEKEKGLFAELFSSDIVNNWEVSGRVSVQMAPAEFDAPSQVTTPLEALRTHQESAFVEPFVPVDTIWIKVGRASTEAFDSSYAERLWGLFATKCIDAFRLGEKGSEDVVVGVVDTGISSHSDLQGSLVDFTRTGAKAAPTDVHGHGTHVSGELLLHASPFCSFLLGSVASALKAIDYALTAGVQIINNSWGGPLESEALRRALQLAATANHGLGVLVVNSAGNDAQDLNRSSFYPASVQLPNSITVAAMTPGGQLVSYSNYGAKSVHLAAPGENIYSDLPRNRYGYRSGSSSAAPFVAAVAALVYGAFSGVGSRPHAQEVKEILRVSSAPENDLVGKVAWGATVDAQAAVQLVNELAEREPCAPVTHLGGMWAQLKCSDKQFELKPGEARVVTVYVRAYMPGNYKELSKHTSCKPQKREERLLVCCSLCNFAHRAELQVSVSSAATGERVAGGAVSIRMSSNQFIPLEIREANLQRAVQAEEAFADFLKEADESTSDLCGLQQRFLVTTRATSLLSSNAGEDDGETSDGHTTPWIIAGGTAGLLLLLVAAGFLIKTRWSRRPDYVLEHDEALMPSRKDEEEGLLSEFGDALSEEAQRAALLEEAAPSARYCLISSAS